jgi:hypothetical protein
MTSLDLDTAKTLYQQALASVRGLEMRPRQPHCHSGLRKLYRRAGTRQEAPEHLRTATTMYRERDMRLWLERAEADVKVT